MNGKYNIGDLVRISAWNKTMMAIITNETILFQKVLYEMVICGKENKVYYVYEHDVVEKVE